MKFPDSGTYSIIFSKKNNDFKPIKKDKALKYIALLINLFSSISSGFYSYFVPRGCNMLVMYTWYGKMFPTNAVFCANRMLIKQIK